MNWGRSRIKSIKETVRTVKDKCHTGSMALYCWCNKDEVAVICMKRIKGLQSIWAMSQRNGSPLSQSLVWFAKQEMANWKPPHKGYTWRWISLRIHLRK